MRLQPAPVSSSSPREGRRGGGRKLRPPAPKHVHEVHVLGAGLGSDLEGNKKRENRLQEIRGSSVLRSNNCILMQGTTISRPKKGLGGSCVMKVGKMYVESPAKFASQIYSFSSLYRAQCAKMCPSSKTLTHSLKKLNYYHEHKPDKKYLEMVCREVKTLLRRNFARQKKDSVSVSYRILKKVHNTQQQHILLQFLGKKFFPLEIPTEDQGREPDGVGVGCISPSEFRQNCRSQLTDSPENVGTKPQPEFKIVNPVVVFT